MTMIDKLLRREAEQVQCELRAQDEAWGTKGWTRRRFVAGAGMVGAAALGSQLVTTRAAYASTPSVGQRSMIVVFMRGACDGLRVLVPNAPTLGLDYLKTVRAGLLPSAANLIALPNSSGWALNAKLAPLYNSLWASGEMAFVPAVSTPGVSRSHFQAQQFLERGGSDTATSGWLDRVLEKLGPGTTFRAVAEGAAIPTSLAGPQTAVALSSIANFKFPGWDSIRPASQEAVLSLYRGLSGTLGEDVPIAIGALNTAATIQAANPSHIAYPSGAFGNALKDLSTILKSEVGLQVATVDVGGWDTHTDEVSDLDKSLDSTAQTLRAFMDDLGPDRRSRVTVVVMTEFGRRVAMNASGGTDHGHGSVMWLLGGGLKNSGVFGRWNALAAGSLDQGDVPGLNNPFDVLGEVVQKRLSSGSLSGVFADHNVNPLGIISTS
ncbi:DUF1501 domain-containing protein [uncultured Jatrophihabitans sp.]|uniref:DUF1501 domain-containing protein n=1 Tax=uncultured Jatrophihabitans sp. TaxID=1610747 RepID=UPI0035CC0E97